MVGDHVEIVPLDRGDGSELWQTLAGEDDAIWTYMGYGPFESQAEMEELVESWVGLDDPMFFTFRIDTVPVGWGAYMRITPEHGCLEVGNLVFGSQMRRATAATEAMYLMARTVFDRGYRRYEWKCDALNAASRRAAERLGFTYEGTFRQHMVYKGRNRDTAWYAMTDADWPQVRRRFEAWLDPANFDRTGRQLTRLQGDG